MSNCDQIITGFDLWYLKLPVVSARDHGIGRVDGSCEVIVLRLTAEGGAEGFGEASPWSVFTGSPEASFAALDRYIRPHVVGRKVADRAGIMADADRAVAHCTEAKAALESALLDLEGHIRGQPVYDLLGGKAREAAAVYVHASGSSAEEVGDKMQAFMERGFHHIRVQVSTPGYSTYGNKSAKSGTDTSSNRDVSQGPIPITTRLREYDPAKRYAHPGGVFEPKPYLRSALNLFEYIRDRFGYGVEILHDVHERIPPILGVWFAKEVERFQLFFLEDLFSPEDNDRVQAENVDVDRARRRHPAGPLQDHAASAAVAGRLPDRRGGAVGAGRLRGVRAA